MKNIYNKKLESCGNKNMTNGSWDNNKMYSEIDGGVHLKYMYKKYIKKYTKVLTNTGQ